MNKEVRNTIKDLKKYGIAGTQRVIQRNHIRVYMEGICDDGNPIEGGLKFTLPISPRDRNWMKNFERQKKKYLKSKNISEK